MEATIATKSKKKPVKAKKPAAKKAAKKATPVKKAAAKKTAKPAVKKPAAKKAAAPPMSVKNVAAPAGFLKTVIHSLDQDKAQNIVSIDLKGKTSIADFMVIATGTSSRHVAAMASKLAERVRKDGYRPKIEGKDTGDWVIVDTGDIIVHLFRQEVREFYNLEKLWDADFSTVGYNLYTTQK